MKTNKILLISSLLYMVNISIAKPIKKEDKLIGRFCIEETINMEIYKTKNGDKYTTGVDIVENTYGSAKTIKEIIEGEHGVKGKCKAN